MPKCQWCKETSDKTLMHCDETVSTQLNKKGEPKVVRKYYHFGCHNEHLQDKEFKRIDLEELDKLYSHLINLHNLETLDGRMMEKIQDLRNGTIKLHNKKIKKYKEGVRYSLMLNAYKHAHESIMNTFQYMNYKTKWNEFSYIFGIMTNAINEVTAIASQAEKVTVPKKVDVDAITVQVQKRNNAKKDELDISEFL